MFNDMSLSKNSNFKTKIYAKYKKTEASVSALHKVQEPVNPMTALEYYEGSDKLMIAAINNGSEQWNAYVKKLRAKASCELIIISNLDCERINFAQYDLANIAFRDSSFHVCSFNKSIISNLQFVNADLRCVNLSEPNWSDEAKADARLRTIIISQSKIHNSNIHPPDEVDTVKITHSQIVKTSIGFSFANDITWYDNSFEGAMGGARVAGPGSAVRRGCRVGSASACSRWGWRRVVGIGRGRGRWRARGVGRTACRVRLSGAG